MAGRVAIDGISTIVVKRRFHESVEEIPVLDLLNAKFLCSERNYTEVHWKGEVINIRIKEGIKKITQK